MADVVGPPQAQVRERLAAGVSGALADEEEELVAVLLVPQVALAGPCAYAAARAGAGRASAGGRWGVVLAGCRGE